MCVGVCVCVCVKLHGEVFTFVDSVALRLVTVQQTRACTNPRDSEGWRAVISGYLIPTHFFDSVESASESHFSGNAPSDGARSPRASHAGFETQRGRV